MEEQKKSKTVSELRQDIVTGDWVVIATARAKRPHEFIHHTPRKEVQSDQDPFENPEVSGQEDDVLIYRHNDGDWSLRVFPNKFPAFKRGVASKNLDEGPYKALTGVGYHEVVVTRDKEKTIPFMETWRVAELFDAFQDRYLQLMNKKTVHCVQIFHNQGMAAGASVRHPHSQIMAFPVISPEMEIALRGAENYYRAHKRNVFAVMEEYEQAEKKRVVFENEHFLVFCPFASRAAFEMKILPKRDNPYFERITDEEKVSVAEALQQALLALTVGLETPSYNFYIHTAPCDGRDYPHYRWHIDIVPRTDVWAGFELATSIEINSMPPEKAAEFLRQQLTNQKAS